MKKSIKKGFTIVELVIVIAVIGILAAVLIPTFSNVISSARAAADLQEAESTLKAYVSYMGGQGKELSDGVVFKVGERQWVYYKGQLREFSTANEADLGDFAASQTEVKDISADGGPVVTIGSTKYACINRFQLQIGGYAKGIADGSSIYFYYTDSVKITFEDGSLKCSIHPGIIYKDNADITKYFAVESEVELKNYAFQKVATFTLELVDTNITTLNIKSGSNTLTVVNEGVGDYSITEGIITFTDTGLAKIVDTIEITE